MIGRTNVGGGSSAPSYSIHGWCATVGLSYAVLADIPEADMRTLMTKYASVAYFMEWYSNDPSMIDDFIANSYAMKWIGLRDYICDQLMALQSVRTKMLASANWEYILKDHVPIMTSATAPYGEVSASGEYSTYLAWKAFDADDATRWMPSNAVVTNQWIQYTFTNPICIKKVFIKSSVADRLHNFKILASNDNFGNDSHELYSGTNTNTTLSIDISNDNYYRTYRLLIIDSNHSAVSGCDTLQFYGRSLNVSVPKMTSNTAPYGQVSASSQDSSGNYDAYMGFITDGGTRHWYPSVSDGTKSYLQYDFGKEVFLKAYKLGYYMSATASRLTTLGVTVLASNDNFVSESVAITNEVIYRANATVYHNNEVIPVNATKPYRYYRLYQSTLVVSGTIQVGFGQCNFFGVDYSERTDRTYLYDHGIKFVPMSIGIKDGLDGLGTITENANSVTSDCPAANKDQAPYFTNSTIDITPYSHACAIFNTVRYLSGVEAGFARLRIGTTRGFGSSTGSKGNINVNMNTNASQNLSVLDVSNINESCYFGFGAVLLSDAGQYCTVDIYELWLE